MTREQVLAALNEAPGKIETFQIDFEPRVNIFKVVSEENLIRLIKNGVNAFSGWRFDSLAFLVVNGNRDGFRVTVTRKTPLFQTAGAEAFAWPVAVAIVGLAAFAFTPFQVRRTFQEFPKEAITELATGVKFAGLGVPGLVLLGFAVLYFAFRE